MHHGSNYHETYRWNKWGYKFLHWQYYHNPNFRIHYQNHKNSSYLTCWELHQDRSEGCPSVLFTISNYFIYVKSLKLKKKIEFGIIYIAHIGIIWTMCIKPLRPWVTPLTNLFATEVNYLNVSYFILLFSLIFHCFVYMSVCIDCCQEYRNYWN